MFVPVSGMQTLHISHPLTWPDYQRMHSPNQWPHSLETRQTLQICSLQKTTLSTPEMKKSCCLFEHAVAQVTVTLHNPSFYRNQLSIMKARKDADNSRHSLLDLLWWQWSLPSLSRYTWWVRKEFVLITDERNAKLLTHSPGMQYNLGRKFKSERILIWRYLPCGWLFFCITHHKLFIISTLNFSTCKQRG